MAAMDMAENMAVRDDVENMLRNREFRTMDNVVYLGMLRSLILEGHEVALVVEGGSMTPFLIHRRDRVLLAPLTDEPSRGDVVMYQRTDGQYVLHRIVGVTPERTYVLCGDAQVEREFGVAREQIFARVKAIERKGKWIYPGSFFWFFFAQVWSRMIPLRQELLICYRVVRGKSFFSSNSSR